MRQGRIFQTDFQRGHDEFNEAVKKGGGAQVMEEVVTSPV